MTEDQKGQQSPVDQYPQEVSDQTSDYPGLESEMGPRPDYGEESYRGNGRPGGLHVDVVIPEPPGLPSPKSR